LSEKARAVWRTRCCSSVSSKSMVRHATWPWVPSHLLQSPGVVLAA